MVGSDCGGGGDGSDSGVGDNGSNSAGDDADGSDCGGGDNIQLPAYINTRTMQLPRLEEKLSKSMCENKFTKKFSNFVQPGCTKISR